MRHEKYSYRLVVAANQNIKEKNYWLKKLSDRPVKAVLPYDFIKTVKAETGVSVHMDTLEFRWSGELFSRLMALSNGFDYTLHIILLSGLVLLLGRYGQTGDVLIGSPIYKQEKDIEFINTVLVLRSRVTGAMTFKELLLQAKQTVVEAAEHQNYPFQVLQDQLGAPGSAADNALFDVVLLLENIHDRNYIRDVDYHLLFSFLRSGEGIDVRLEYDTILYREETAARVVRHFTRLLEKAVSDVNTRLDDIDILSEEEEQQVLYDFNGTESAYAEDKTLVRLFEAQAAKTPDSVGIVGGVAPPANKDERSGETVQITYRELNKRSNRLAYFLRKKGVTSDTIVGIMVEPSIDMIAGMLGILKAGGAYLPIDPKTPTNRAASMLEESDAPVLLTERSSLDHHSFRALQYPGLTRVKPKVSAGRERIIDMDRLPLPDRSLIDYDKYNRYIGYAGVKHMVVYIVIRFSRVSR
jgi:non-ribosomal peptide synthetase component F